ncbi:IS2 transposase TnpB [Histomonas meleagridis]|uniref:IS2 transposase TnpB n=1 Tax=Histomonas meleagridis TaxID=135588 RepID=UPI003559EC95|nr:IS2 transposase TnpB [Histomonas meleagridis]KAH0798279.1 IS2 transposase TnpB [Histomonas meleagridis]
MERGPYKQQIYTFEQILEFERRIKEHKQTIKGLMKEEKIGIKRLKKEFALAQVPFPEIQRGKPSEITNASALARIVIDNGGEFVGKPYQAILSHNGIKDWRTAPYTPQQNGKMERWWETYEISKGASDLQTVIYEYNFAWRHHGLHEMTRKWMTPSDMWLSEPHWSPGCPDEVEFVKKISAK